MPDLTGSLSFPSAVLIGGLFAVVFADFLVIGKEQEATDARLHFLCDRTKLEPHIYSAVHV